MKRLRQMIGAAPRKAHGARAVPVMVPHGGAEASRDFESAFEMLQGDDQAHELWHGKPVKIPFAPAS